MSQIFQAVLGSTASAHPLVITTASRLLGQFSGWINDRALAARAFETVSAVLQYLTGALDSPLAAQMPLGVLCNLQQAVRDA